MNISYDFSGKVALVTGAGSGIGRSSAIAFADAGATVIVVDVNRTGGEAVVAEILAAGGLAEFHATDVSDPTAVSALVDGIVAKHGGLDIAHNNAGVEGIHVDVADIPLDDWHRVLHIDLDSMFYCLRAEIPAMLNRGGGAIVNTASAAGLVGGYQLGAYTAAKHGLVGLTKAAAVEYGSRGVRINAVCPGLTDTPFIGALPPVARDRLMLGTPQGRLATPDEIAQAVLWLCSDGASYVLGTPLAVDGGVVLGAGGTKFDDLQMP